MSDLLIIDGYNVIFAVDPYRELKDDPGMETAVDKLVGDLINLSGSIDSEILVVFDGRGAGSSKAAAAGVTVVYSPGRRTADEVIERLVFEHHLEQGITVCTADYAQQKVVWRHGVKRLLPAGLMDLMTQEAEEEREVQGPAAKSLRVEDRLPESVRRSLDRLRRSE